MKKTILFSVSCFLFSLAAAQPLLQPWPLQGEPGQRPGARWWWMGSAVDEAGLTANMEQYAAGGLGTLEITPIYGVQGNQANEVEYLSPRWMELYRHAVSEGERLGIRIDLNNGTGWPWGGPAVGEADAAKKLLWRSDSLLTRLTGQQVKRAAPGGEGYVLDHFSARTVDNYLNRFAEKMGDGPWPAMLFTDSYEVYGADWTPGFEEEFAERRGYRIEDHMAEFMADERTQTGRRVVADYRQTLGELLLEHFAQRWTAFAHAHGTLTRGQAHGSPANLIDIYAAFDVPEAEGFGMTDFSIAGLRRDSLVRPNDSDASMLKYASSAAHIAGKKYTSAETFTWLTEHFRTSLSQMKPDLDLLFCSGVNRVFYHGTTYSPPEVPWPGWKFYASVDLSPTNPIWRDVDGLNAYAARCQSMLQWGMPDNDLLLYFPVHDIWHEEPGRLLLFDIHKMASRAPRFIAAVNAIMDEGYDLDYISDNYLIDTRFDDGQLVTAAGTRYRAIVVPGAKMMPVETLRHLVALAVQGAKVVFLDRLPDDVPGLHRLDERRAELAGLLASMPAVGRSLADCGVQPETLRSEHALSYIRRSNPGGHHYFLSALGPQGVRGWVTLATSDVDAALLDPMDGSAGKAASRLVDGRLQVYVDIPSGGSLFIRTYARNQPDLPRWTYYRTGRTRLELRDFEPALGAWQSDSMGTATYRTTIDLPHSGRWRLALGDVRESARVRVDGVEVAVVWAAPFEMQLPLSIGEHLIEIDVTNLPANRIAAMDRAGEQWRRFKDINFVKLNYVEGDYSHWERMPSGLLGPVTLTALETIRPR